MSTFLEEIILKLGLRVSSGGALDVCDVFRWTALLALFCAGAVWPFRKTPRHAKMAEECIEGEPALLETKRAYTFG